MDKSQQRWRTGGPAKPLMNLPALTTEREAPIKAPGPSYMNPAVVWILLRRSLNPPIATRPPGHGDNLNQDYPASIEHPEVQERT